jgi:tRNA pseudouridine55 synthase
MTSHDIVSRIRRLTGIRQVGHTGTLDPNAAGVLPIAVGKATKAIAYLDEGRKVYRAELCLGTDTDTGDRYGEILEKTEDRVRTKDEFLRAAQSLTGQIDQVPPIYSAIRIDGKRAYDLARMGKTPEMKTRRVNIERIELVSYEESRFIFDLVCSKGTYVRSLCRDLGLAMGSLGHMSMLIRLESGIFTAEKAIYDWDHLEDKLMPLEAALRHFPKIVVDDGEEKRLLYGQTIPSQGLEAKRLVRVYGPSRFLGIAEQHRHTIKMKRQFV